MSLAFLRTDAKPVRLTTGERRLRAACGQCLGAREDQQDAYGLFPAVAGILAVVADGMGGMARGGAAAALAVRAAGQQAAGLFGAETSFASLKDLLARADRAVYEGIDCGGIVGLAGTTLCAALIEGDRARLFWCGDSRIYLLRAGRLHKLTEDHIYARYLRQMVEEGVITEADARANPRRDHLTGYLGMGALEDYSITTAPMRLQGGDRLLLCTDGLYRALNEAEMADSLAAPPQAAAGRLIRAVAQRRLPGQDNATALVLQFG